MRGNTVEEAKTTGHEENETTCGPYIQLYTNYITYLDCALPGREPGADETRDPTVPIEQLVEESEMLKILHRSKTILFFWVSI